MENYFRSLWTQNLLINQNTLVIFDIQMGNDLF
jgi:hypothetical protein